MLGSLAERDTEVSSLSVALCYYPAKPSDWLLLDGPGLELLDPVLVRLAEAFTQSSVSLPAYLPRQGMLHDRTADSERLGGRGSGPAAFKFKFVCLRIFALPLHDRRLITCYLSDTNHDASGFGSNSTRVLRLTENH